MGGRRLSLKLFDKLRNKRRSALDAPQNAYYEGVSEKLGILQVVLYLSLFAFVVLSFFRNTQLITYQNFYYFFKDLNASAETVLADTSDTLSYPTASKQSFALYRGGLSVVSDTSVTIFTASGRQTVSRNVSFSNAVTVGSGKYLLVYELGGTKYALFNSYTQIFEGNTEYPISNAKVSDSGNYVLVTSSKTYTSVVSLYNDRFSLINRYNKNGYVTDVAIDREGERLAVVSVHSRDGLFLSELMICDVGASTARHTVEIEDIAVFSCTFAADDRISLLHSGGLLFYGVNGKVIRQHVFDGYTVTHATLTPYGNAVCLTEDENPQQQVLRVYDEDGRLLCEQATEERMLQLSISSDCLCWLSEKGVHAVWFRSEKNIFLECDTSEKYLISVGNGEALLCSGQKAEYLTLQIQK